MYRSTVPGRGLYTPVSSLETVGWTTPMSWAHTVADTPAANRNLRSSGPVGTSFCMTGATIAESAWLHPCRLGGDRATLPMAMAAQAEPVIYHQRMSVVPETAWLRDVRRELQGRVGAKV